MEKPFNPLHVWDAIGWHAGLDVNYRGFYGTINIVDHDEGTSFYSDNTGLFYTREEAEKAVLDLMSYNFAKQYELGIFKNRKD